LTAAAARINHRQMKPRDRLRLSLDTLRKYEAGGIAGLESLPLFRSEMTHIETLGMEHPYLAVETAQIIARWQGYVNRLKLGLH
jgi:hypothetical protein